MRVCSHIYMFIKYVCAQLSYVYVASVPTDFQLRIQNNCFCAEYVYTCSFYYSLTNRALEIIYMAFMLLCVRSI